MKINFVDNVHPVLSTRLTVAGHTCEDLSERNGKELLEQLHDSEGLVVRSRVMLGQLSLDEEQGIIDTTKSWLMARSGERRAYALYLERWGDWLNPWQAPAPPPT